MGGAARVPARSPDPPPHAQAASARRPPDRHLARSTARESARASASTSTPGVVRRWNTVDPTPPRGAKAAKTRADPVVDEDTVTRSSRAEMRAIRWYLVADGGAVPVPAGDRFGEAADREVEKHHESWVESILPRPHRVEDRAPQLGKQVKHLLQNLLFMVRGLGERVAAHRVRHRPCEIRAARRAGIPRQAMSATARTPPGATAHRVPDHHKIRLNLDVRPWSCRPRDPGPPE